MTKRKLSLSKEKEISDLYLSGKRMAEISEWTGKSIHTVSQVLTRKKLNTDRQHLNRSASDYYTVKNLMDSGNSLTAISRKTKIPLSTVFYWKEKIKSGFNPKNKKYKSKNYEIEKELSSKQEVEKNVTINVIVVSSNSELSNIINQLKSL